MEHDKALDFGVDEESAVWERAFNDYLQPDSTLEFQTAMGTILSAIPKDKGPSDFDYQLSLDIFRFAEKIPYNHPSQPKFARLVKKLMESKEIKQSQKRKSSEMEPLHTLSMVMRDNLQYPDPNSPREYVNFMTFAAHLQEQLGWYPGLWTWSIWANRDAHEERDAGRATVLQDAYVLAAAQRILCTGQALFKIFVSKPELDEHDERSWSVGERFKGGILSLERWHFWEKSFKKFASRTDKSKDEFVQECKREALKASESMEALEKNSLG